MSPPQSEQEDKDPSQESLFSFFKKKSSSTTTTTTTTALSFKDEFWTIVWDGMAKVMSEAPTIWASSETNNKNNNNNKTNNSNENEYEAEKLFLAEACRPFMYGIGATCIFFITFRVAGSQWWKQQLLKRKNNASNNRTNHHESQQQQAQQQWKSYSERQLEERSQLLQEALSIPLDLLLSMALGLSITAITTRPSKLQTDLQQSPVTIHGKSVLVHTLCPPMMQLYHRKQPQNHNHNKSIVNNENNNKDDDNDDDVKIEYYKNDDDKQLSKQQQKQQQKPYHDDYMIWLQLFTQNCQARFDLEQQLLQLEQNEDADPDHDDMNENNNNNNNNNNGGDNALGHDIAIPPGRLRTLMIQQQQQGNVKS